MPDTKTRTPCAADDASRLLDAAILTRLQALQANVEKVFHGKSDVVRLAIACLLAEGHLLLEDVPGVGKTTLARAIASSINVPLRRVQFTSDLLPSDIIGVTIFDKQANRFEFHRGPLFHNIVLADEINRASPRTQSALLEAMHERQVSVDNETHMLPRPFLVVATQNPFEFHGTYPLPESQLDRFMLRLSIGYPDPAVERDLVASRGRHEPVDTLEPVMDADTLDVLMVAVEDVHVEDTLVDYLMAVAQGTRESTRFEQGASTRACLTTLRVAKAHALTRGRCHLLPDDLDAVLVPALAHRIRLAGPSAIAGARRQEAERTLAELIARVPRPM